MLADSRRLKLCWDLSRHNLLTTAMSKVADPIRLRAVCQALPSGTAPVAAAMLDDFAGNTVCIRAHRPRNVRQCIRTGMGGSLSLQVVIIRHSDI